MGEFRLHALAINEVRDVFGADDVLAAKLRNWALEAFPTPAQPDRHVGRNHLFRRARRRPHIVMHRAGSPTERTADDLLEGRFVAPNELVKSWRVLDLWLEKLSWGTLTTSCTRREYDALEFELARAGVPSYLGLNRLFGGDPQIPLRPAPGMRVGYSRASHVEATCTALDRAIPYLSDDNAQSIRTLVDFLEQFPSWYEEARAAGRPRPDLIILRHEDPATLAVVPSVSTPGSGILPTRSAS